MNLPSSGIEPKSPALAGGFFYHFATRDTPFLILPIYKIKRSQLVLAPLWVRGAAGTRLKRDTTDGAVQEGRT